MGGIFLMVSCARKNELKPEPSGPGIKDCHADPRTLRTLENLLQRDTAYSGYALDSAATVRCVARGNYIVYLVKISKTAQGSVESSGYAGLCINAQTDQHSQSFTFFDAGMIEQSDSTWDEAIRLMSEPYLAIDSAGSGEGMRLVVKQRVANGTFYHAVVDRYYRIDPVTLELKYEFSIESLSWVPIEEVYIRRVKQNGVIQVYMSREKEAQGEPIGKFELDRAHAWAPVNIVIDNDRYEHVMVTSSPRGEITPP